MRDLCWELMIVTTSPKNKTVIVSWFIYTCFGGFSCHLSQKQKSYKENWALFFFWHPLYQHVSLETDMPDWRPIGDQNAALATNMPDQRTTLGKICISYGMPVSDEAWWSPMGFRCGISVSNQAYGPLMRHVGLRWVSDQAYGSPMRHVGLQSKVEI